MKVIKYEDIAAREVLPGVTKRVLVGAGDGAPNFTMRMFEAAPGSTTYIHSHPWEHEIFVLAGEGKAVEADNEIPIRAGNVVFIEPGAHHHLVNSGTEAMRFICMVPNEGES